MSNLLRNVPKERRILTYSVTVKPFAIRITMCHCGPTYNFIIFCLYDNISLCFCMETKFTENISNFMQIKDRIANDK